MQDKLMVNIKDEKAINKLSSFFYDLINTTNKQYENIIFICIGTDRSAGDSLAPIVGAKLNGKYIIYGNLHNPVHAKNLENTINSIDTEKNLIIAVDASLGREEDIGKVCIKKGSIKAGSGVGKDLPAVGDIAITGVVNISGFMEYVVLQNTRLSLVMDLADTISKTITSTMKKYNKVRKIA